MIERIYVSNIRHTKYRRKASGEPLDGDVNGTKGWVLAPNIVSAVDYREVGLSYEPRNGGYYSLRHCSGCGVVANNIQEMNW